MEFDLLILGYSLDNLGGAIQSEAQSRGMTTLTVGTDPDAEVRIPFFRAEAEYAVIDQFASLFTSTVARNVVCTIGTNPSPNSWFNGGYERVMSDTMFVNVLVPFHAMSCWFRGPNPQRYLRTQHFVAVSSNSAHIARRNSMAYCTSKAALSMMLRCAAREAAGLPVAIYGYEPGWIEDTPMSEAKSIQMGDQKPHRIPSSVGLYRDELARTIVENICIGGRAFNGTLLRIDGGEQ